MPEHQNGSASDSDLQPVPRSGLPKETGLRDRLELLRDQFCARFKAEPTLYIRVPGRVNLIGEHIDYCGYSVCPMALEQDILVAFRPTEMHTFLTILNQDVKKYVEYTMDCRSLKFSLDKTGWASYILCGVRGVSEQLARSNNVPVSMEMAVSGIIPPASGLSSSSALVCAGVLATALCNKLELSKTQLAALSAEAERYIGTVGGGMDQAIIFLASEGCAKLIDFNPLRTRDVSLPAGAVFVVAHSLATKNKAASNEFNTRVVECRLAAQVLAKSRSLSWEKCLRLAEFQAAAALTLREAVELVQETLHETPYTKAEVCKILEVTESQLNQLSLTPNTEQVGTFKLYQRALHVFQEAERVAQFEAGCCSGCALPVLGQLMSQSHVSLRDLYECSHSQLDRLVDVAMAAGALGARLTGAGWGGCIVALTTEDHVEEFIASVKTQFYADNPQVEGHKLENLVFATQPGRGVQVFSPLIDHIV